VLLADEQVMFRQAVRSLLEKANGFEVVAEARDGLQAILLIEEHAPDVVVIETLLPRLSGVEVTRRVRNMAVGTQFLFLSIRGEKRDVEAAIKAGALGYVCKTDAPEELLEAIHAVAQGRLHLSSSLARHLREFAVGDEPTVESRHLTSREREVLQLIAEGLSSKQIGGQLKISTRTVESHRAKLMEKLGVRNVSGLVRYAIREGLISLASL
jgi:DNA-binding NarL/FixJ family response regulator